MLIREECARVSERIRYLVPADNYSLRVACYEQHYLGMENSQICWIGLYLRLLCAVYYNDRSSLRWLLAKTRDVAVSGNVNPADVKDPPFDIRTILSGNLYIRTSNRFRSFFSHGLNDHTLPNLWRNFEASFLCDVPFSITDVIESLLHYSVLCGRLEIAKYLIARGVQVSAYSREWYPFLPAHNTATPLSLALFLEQHDMVSLLLGAGASPYEQIYVNGCLDWEYYTWSVFEKHLQANKVPVRQYLPAPLPVVTRLLRRGDDRTIDWLKATFCWAGVSYESEALATLIEPMCRSFLEFPCHSKEEVEHKQTICVRLLTYITRVSSSVSSSDRIYDLVRDLVRHGGHICGFPAVTSRAQLRQPVAKVNLPGGGPQITRNQLPFELPSSRSMLSFLAPCARICILVTVTTQLDMQHFWAGLSESESVTNPVVQALFDCGGLPHVRSLQCLPLSPSDQKLHDGPTCQCTGVELSDVQRERSVTDLFRVNTIPSLQAVCRSTILSSCQGHGVVPALMKLKLPAPLLDYLLFNVRGGDMRFRQ